MTQFKVGDWVRHPSYGIGKVLTYQTSGPFHTVEVKGSSLWGTRSTKDGTFDRWIPLTYIEPWEPTEGEWCWFYKEEIKPKHIGTHWAIPNLHKFGKTTESGIQTIEGFCYSFCEPFIGQLPSFLKDNT